MYLLDPASGRRRRRALTEHARDAFDAGRGWVGRAGRNVTDTISSSAAQLVDRACEHSPEVAFEPRRVPIPVLPGVIGAGAMLALGAAMVYLLDPDLGASRRGKIRDRLHDSITDTGEFLRRARSRFDRRSHGPEEVSPVEREVAPNLH